jgi:hypothetical protein
MGMGNHEHQGQKQLQSSAEWESSKGDYKHRFQEVVFICVHVGDRLKQFSRQLRDT